MNGLSEREIALIRALNDDLRPVERPYAELAERAGLTEAETLKLLGSLRERGLLRRIGAALVPQEAGVRANAMVVWAVPEAEIAEIGERMAAHPQVSHCYQRPALPELPYSLYTMCHATDGADLERVVAELAEIAGTDDCQVLATRKQYKKQSPVYFPEAPAGARP
jgi:DNA-binding Lrp family transcriptional regulator